MSVELINRVGFVIFIGERELEEGEDIDRFLVFGENWSKEKKKGGKKNCDVSVFSVRVDARLPPPLWPVRQINGCTAPLPIINL